MDINAQGKAKDFLYFQQRRKITNLYKQFLYILEDIRDEQGVRPEVYEKARKRILDHGNDAIRELEENLEKFDVFLK